MDLKKTFCMIKPDSFRKKNVGAILSRIEKEGFKIHKAKLVKPSLDFCKIFYQEHIDKDFFSSLTQFISSGPVLALVLEREDACQFLRKIMGTTDPKKADKTSIRYQYGESIEQNAIHGSDSPGSACREMALFFQEEK